MIALVFPGQGSQKLSMFDDWHDQEQFLFTIQKASNFLGYNVLEKISSMSDKELTQTKNAQLFITLLSMAISDSWKEKCSVPVSAVLGHSVGEYAAYFYSGSLSFEDTIKSVKYRGQIMSDALPDNFGGLISINVDNKILDKVKSLLDSKIYITCYNSYFRLVYGGDFDSLEIFKSRLQENKIEYVDLKVSAPFHTPYFEKCTRQMKDFLKSINLQNSKIPVISNVDGLEKNNFTEIIESLANQIPNPVQWVHSIENTIKKGIKFFVVFGPPEGKYHVMIKEIAPEIRTFLVHDKISLNETVEALKNYDSSFYLDQYKIINRAYMFL